MNESTNKNRIERPRTTSSPANAEHWPVLARIRRVSTDADASSVAPSAWESDLSAALAPRQEELRIIGDYDVAGGDGVEVERRRAHQERYVDRAHVSSSEPQSESPDLIAIPSAAERPAAPGKQVVDVHFESLEAEPSIGLAPRLYRIHSAMAPYAGVIVAVALVLSAGLLYWLTLAPPRQAMNYEELFGPSSQPWTYDSEPNALTSPAKDEVYPIANASETSPAQTIAASPGAPDAGIAEPVYEPFGDWSNATSNYSAQVAAQEAARSATAPRPLAADGTEQPVDMVPTPETNNLETVKSSSPTAEYATTGAMPFDISKAFPDAPPTALESSPTFGDSQVAELPNSTPPGATSTR